MKGRNLRTVESVEHGCREQTDFENVTNFVDIEIAVQYRNAVCNFIYL